MRWAEHVARRATREVNAGFWWGNPRERGTLKDPGVEGSRVLKCIFKKWYWKTDWIDLAQYRHRWWVLVNAVMNLRVPQNVGNFLTS
jgi:hypothetical protein